MAALKRIDVRCMPYITNPMCGGWQPQVQRTWGWFEIRCRLDLDALLEAVDQGDECLGGGDIGVLVAGQFDQFHRFVALFAPGDEDLQGFALEGGELGRRPPGLGAEGEGLQLALQLETGGRLTYLAVELSMAPPQITPTNHPQIIPTNQGLDSGLTRPLRQARP